MSPKGTSYLAQLKRKFWDRELIAEYEEDDWDILVEMDYLAKRGFRSDSEAILGMHLRGRGLGTTAGPIEDYGEQAVKEEEDRVRSTLRRLFEAGYISYA